MKNWVPPMPTQWAGLVSHKEDELIVGSIVEIHSVQSPAHLNGSQGSLVQFLGTWSEFNDTFLNNFLFKNVAKALNYQCMVTVRDLQLLVYGTLSYYCMRP
jgi:hypothetical protein